MSESERGVGSVGNTAPQTKAWQLVQLANEGQFPTTRQDALRWLVVLDSGLRSTENRAERIRKLLAFVAASAQESGGMSIRQIGATIGRKHGWAQRLVDQGRTLTAADVQSKERDRRS